VEERVVRVFPRRTNATPIDDLAVVGRFPGLFDEADKVEISWTFSWDGRLVEQLEQAWRHVAPVKVGGPAAGDSGGVFVPGRYLKHGYVITSRGCMNRCWFCDVWRREGSIRELPIEEGYDVLDPSLLQCSGAHIDGVFSMLARQKHPARFTGGLEARLITSDIAAKLRALRPETIFCAYDTPDDLEPLRQAGRLLLDAGFTFASHCLRAYVLCGYRGDTFDAAERRMRETIEAGFMPMAMVYRDKAGTKAPEWAKWQRGWARPAIIACKIRTA
jgi:hypothetical protein